MEVVVPADSTRLAGTARAVRPAGLVLLKIAGSGRVPLDREIAMTPHAQDRQSGQGSLDFGMLRSARDPLAGNVTPRRPLAGPVPMFQPLIVRVIVGLLSPSRVSAAG